MKKLLFIALLSLVTLGAKAYDVIFINNTQSSSLACDISFRWAGNSIVTLNPNTRDTLTYSDQGDTYLSVASTGSCCNIFGPPTPSHNSNSALIIITSPAPIIPSPFDVIQCSRAAFWWTVTVSHDPLTDTYTVEIS